MTLWSCDLVTWFNVICFTGQSNIGSSTTPITWTLIKTLYSFSQFISYWKGRNVVEMFPQSPMNGWKNLLFLYWSIFAFFTFNSYFNCGNVWKSQQQIFLFVKITESVFFKFDKWLKIGHVGFAGFPTNQALRQTDRQTEIESIQEREGAWEKQIERKREREPGRDEGVSPRR